VVPDDDDKDKTPVEPFIRRRSSQSALQAIGWPDCPACTRKVDGRLVVDERADCDLCWDPKEERFARHVPVDVAIAWRQKHGKEEA